MKDFHDVWALARAFAFDGARLQRAVTACFERRRTAWTEEAPRALTADFYQIPEIATRWRNYLAAGAVLVPPPDRSRKSVNASYSSLARCGRTSWQVNSQSFGHLEARGAAESYISVQLVAQLQHDAPAEHQRIQKSLAVQDIQDFDLEHPGPRALLTHAFDATMPPCCVRNPPEAVWLNNLSIYCRI